MCKASFVLLSLWWWVYLMLRLFVCFVCFVSQRPRQQLGYIVDRSQDWRLTILRAASHETKRGDHDFCLSWSHYTDTGPTSRERAATEGNRTQDLLTRSGELYQLSYHTPFILRSSRKSSKGLIGSETKLQNGDSKWTSSNHDFKLTECKWTWSSL